MNQKDKVNNSKIFAVVSVIGFVACISSFAIAIVNANYIGFLLFLLAGLYCMNHFITYLKHRKK